MIILHFHLRKSILLLVHLILRGGDICDCTSYDNLNYVSLPVGKSSKYFSSQFLHVQDLSVFNVEFVSDIIMSSKAIDLQLVLKEMIFRECYEKLWCDLRDLEDSRTC